MAVVPNKDGQDQFTDKHVYTPNDVRTTETAAKPSPGSPSANPNYVPAPGTP